MCANEVCILLYSTVGAIITNSNSIHDDKILTLGKTRREGIYIAENPGSVQPTYIQYSLDEFQARSLGVMIDIRRRPTVLVQHFNYRGFSHRRKGAAIHIIYMVWLYRSPISVGDIWIFLYKYYFCIGRQLLNVVVYVT